MQEPLLTIFTPTYNRAHLLPRVYESLCRQTDKDFCWLVIDDGSTDGTRELVNKWMQEKGAFEVQYIYKENGGLYTGYNVAYLSIQTELCVCVDSDDYMPDYAVELIHRIWGEHADLHDKVCGIEGLDYDVNTQQPIGGAFVSTGCVWHADMQHVGDTKMVFRTDLVRQVAPMEGFAGERDFNPHYMQMQMLDKWQVIAQNVNLCWVEYQTGTDSMSEAIYKQYVRSPRSYAKYRLMELQMQHGMTAKRRWMLHVHYVSACILSRDRDWLKNSPCKWMTLLATPAAVVWTGYVKTKASHA